jgi:eukaryotic-like serine/threonine-protein kinase
MLDGRYRLGQPIASGGMATVYAAELVGPGGFARKVAIKRMHGHLAGDEEFLAMFMDEARVAACVHHPNVVATHEVVAEGDELFLVMEYIEGASLGQLVGRANKRGETVPLAIALAIGADMARGLHAAHTARGPDGEALEIVHRDVSPQNVLVGLDGRARITDFGVAKARSRLQITGDGVLKGKMSYMAPELLGGAAAARVTDVYAAGVVLWELCTGRRLFPVSGDAVIGAVLEGAKAPPSRYAPAVPPALDAAVMRALTREPAARFPTAQALATALERVGGAADEDTVRAWVERLSVAPARSSAPELETRTSPGRRSSVPPPPSRPWTPEAVAVPDEVTLPRRPSQPEPWQAASPEWAHTRSTLAPRRRWGPLWLALPAVLVAAAGFVLLPRRDLPTVGSGVALVARTPAHVVAPLPLSVPEAAPAAVPSGEPSARASAVRATPRPRPVADCDPPYTEDATGFRHIKRQCVH